MLRGLQCFDLHPRTPLDDLLRRAVAAWRERHGVSARRFGVEVLGDPGFVFSQERGRSVRLGTADRVLVFIGLRSWAKRPWVTGRWCKGASPTLRTVDRVRAWMASHASAEETAAIRAGIDDGHNFVEAAGRGLSMAPPLAGGAGINLEEEGGRGMNGNGSKYLGTREAAAWLGLSPRTLDRYRVSGDGPAFHRFGSRVRYLAADLEAWVSARRLSMSDDGTVGLEGRP